MAIEDAKQAMADTLTDVLQNMTFAFVESPEDETLPTDESEFLHATIKFTGPSSGEMGIAVSQDLCAELAAGILGLEPDEDEVKESISDTLGELLNVTCGNFITTMFGENQLVSQSIPQVQTLDSNGWKSLVARSETVKFMVDEVPLIAHVAVQEDR